MRRLALGDRGAHPGTDRGTQVLPRSLFYFSHHALRQNTAGLWSEALGNGTQALCCGPLSRFGAERGPAAALLRSRTPPNLTGCPPRSCWPLTGHAQQRSATAGASFAPLRHDGCFGF
jgi:hypothetical protein